MPLVLADRVNETTTTTSTGTVTLAGAVSGYQSFAVIGNANTTYYTIVHQTANEWEVGIGTYTSSGTTLARNTVLASSNSGSLVNFSAGTKFVFCDYPAGRAVYLDTATNVTIPGLTLSGGTANGVLYLNGSKVATSGAALTYDGTTFTSGAHTLSTGVLTVPAGSAAAPSITTTGDTNTGIFFPAADTIAFTEGGVEAARIDSSGNLGIGTTSPSQRLVVRGPDNLGATDIVRVESNNGGQAIRLRFTGMFTNGSNVEVGTDTANDAVFKTNNTERARIDSSGNLGLGVTPSAWSGVGAALQVGTSAAIIGNNVNSSSFISNAYFDGANYRYIGTGFAMRLALTSGAYAFTTAPSGTAGNAISFTQAMTLDASGNLGIGTTTVVSGCKLNVSGGINSTNGALNVSGNGGFYNAANKFGVDNYVGASRFYSSGANSSTKGSYEFHITDSVGTLDTIAMTLDASGNLGIGTSSPGYKLDVRGVTASGNGTITTGFTYDTRGLVGTFSNHALGFITNGASPTMLLDTSGNLGIGTSSPANKFVVSNGGALGFEFVPASGVMQVYNRTTSAYGSFICDGSDFVWRPSGTERMRLDSSGNLGIGTSSPASKLHVANTAAATRITITDDVAAGRSGYIESNYSDALVIGTTSGVRGIRFSPDNTARMFLDTSGNLGIGTSSPAYKLDVNGNIRQSSTALVTAVAGLWEYDGSVNYVTPSGTQRGVVPGMQYYALNASLAGANVSTAQSVLGVGVTLSSNTRYAFEAVYALSKSAGTTSHTTGIGFGGTATINNIGYWAQAGSINSNGFLDLSNSGSFQYYIQTASNTVLNGAQAQAATFRMYKISGTVSIGTGGTFIPQYTLSAAPGGAYTTAAGCWFRIYPIGAAGSNVSVGTWA